MAITVGILLMGAGLFWKFPLFHVVPIEDVTNRQGENIFNAKAFAEDYWRTRLIPRLADAHEAKIVLAALEANADQARLKFGRTVGIGRSTYFLLRGEGTIVSLEKNQVGVALFEGASDADLYIATGPMFGNAVRDTPGAITADEFSHSQDFNALAAENRVAKPLSKESQVGRKVHFVGCIELQGEMPTKLKLIPLDAAVE
jgi:predicted lipoprotein